MVTYSWKKGILISNLNFGATWLLLSVPPLYFIKKTIYFDSTINFAMAFIMWHGAQSP